MLLLAGDLFHENNPSRTSLYQTTAALREYTRGSRPVELIVVGDEGIGIARNAPSVFRTRSMRNGLIGEGWQMVWSQL